MENNTVMKELFGECLAYVKYGQSINPAHVKDMCIKAFEAGRAYEEDQEYVMEEKEGYELINCIECGEDKHVEEGTWALDKGMCEPCYCAYEGG